jgi:hypothetical protein
VRTICCRAYLAAATLSEQAAHRACPSDGADIARRPRWLLLPGILASKSVRGSVALTILASLLLFGQLHHALFLHPEPVHVVHGTETAPPVMVLGQVSSTAQSSHHTGSLKRIRHVTHLAISTHTCVAASASKTAASSAPCVASGGLPARPSCGTPPVGGLSAGSRGLPGRFRPQFRDKNRRGIGKYQSIWTDSKMETAGSPVLG